MHTHYVQPKNAIVINLPKWCFMSVTKGDETMSIEFNKIEIGSGYFKFLRIRNARLNLTKPYIEAKNNDILLIAIFDYITETQKQQVISLLNLNKEKFAKLDK